MAHSNKPTVPYYFRSYIKDDYEMSTHFSLYGKSSQPMKKYVPHPLQYKNMLP